jgi:hypothetical protein
MKNFHVLFLITILGFNSISAQIPIIGLVGKYSFSGNANNEISDSANGLVYGATLTEDRCGEMNSAYHFSLTSDYIAISIFNQLLNNELSISLWAKAETLSSNCLAMLAPDDWNDRCVICAQYIGEPTYLIWDYGNCDYNGRTVVPGLAYSNEWHHYVFITSQSQNLKSIYMDSICMSSQSFMGSLNNNDRDLYIGAGTDWAGGSIGFQGSIDDVRIYDRALSPPEVASLYHENPCFTGINFVKDYDNSAVAIYPVPSYDKIRITGLDHGTIEIRNLQGQIIKAFNIVENNSVVDISKLTSGVYLVKITTDNRCIVKKILVKH